MAILSITEAGPCRSPMRDMCQPKRRLRRRWPPRIPIIIMVFLTACDLALYVRDERRKRICGECLCFRLGLWLRLRGCESAQRKYLRLCKCRSLWKRDREPGGSGRLAQIEALCKPNNGANSNCSVLGSCGQWAAGYVEVQEMNNVTECYSSQNPNSAWIDSNNQSLGRRDYEPTSDGVCTVDNLPTKPNLIVTPHSDVYDSSPSSAAIVTNSGGGTMDWNSSPASYPIESL